MEDPDKMHPEDKRNLIIFGVACILVWNLYNHYILAPRMEKLRAVHAIETAQHLTEAPSPEQIAASKPRPRADVLAESPRLKIDNGSVFGSLALKGGRIDDLSLQRYYTTLEKTDHVVLLAPAGTEYPEYLEFGWVTDDKDVRVPDNDTVWQAAPGSGSILGAGTPITLQWQNGRGLTFERRIEIDQDYLITVTQRVINKSGKPVSLNPYSLVSEHGVPADAKEAGGRIFEGEEAWLDGKLIENNFGQVVGAQIKKKLPTVTAVNGWIGMSQKYWFTGLIPDQKTAKTFRFLYTPTDAPDDSKKGLGKYQVDVTADSQTIAAGGSGEYTAHVFAGAKENNLLQRYAGGLPETRLDLVIDWGMFWFLTKPFFYILDFFRSLTGNFGIAIICLTLIVRAAVFPLANTSFRSFAKMKKISPAMAELRKQYGNEKEKLQAELVKLYEKEKVNPLSGCMPLVVQFPIFLALYKVLSITIEMRHAPFFGWIHDLSAADPTSVFNLFGLLPFTPPDSINLYFFSLSLKIGGWSCMMLAAMLAQRQLSPPAQDKIQEAQLAFMPFFVTYIMSSFPAGLLIYWTVSNTLSVIQQYVIMRGLGVEVNIFTRTRSEREMESLIMEGPEIHPGLIVAEDEMKNAMLGGKEGEAPVSISRPKPKKKKKR